MEYEASKAKFGRLARSDMFVAVCRKRAEAGKVLAESMSPYDESANDKGHAHYKDSFEINKSRGWDGRQGVELVNTVPHAIFVELKNHILGNVRDAISD